jgi:membrane protease YdiL (CAAX protease family)
MKNKLALVLYVLTLLYMGYAGVYLDVSKDKSYYFVILVLFFAVFGLRLFDKSIEKVSWLGNWQLSVKYNMYLLIPVFGLFAIGQYFQIFPKGDLSSLNRGLGFALFPFVYSLISVPIQQLLIFVDLRFRLKELKIDQLTSTVLVAGFYSLIHAYYPQPQIILLSTFILGVIWQQISTKTNSIIGNIISHIIIGLLSFNSNLA